METIVAIALITVLMVALTSLFISAMQGTAHQRATQGAVRIATDEIDQVRGLSYNGALSGRDKTSVQSQFDSAPTVVKGWLAGRNDQAYSDTASTGSGRTQCGEGVAANCAQLPTTAVTRTLNNTSFAVSYYEEWCYRAAADKSTADCVPASSKVTGTTYNQYLRVVLAVGWADSTCPAGDCSYLSSVLLNGTAEPMFYFNDQPPPKPDISGCTPSPVAVGDKFSADDPAYPALDIIGSDGICAFDGGVPPFTWAAAGLPAGLAVTADGHIIGEPTTAGSVSGVKLTVTDAFLIQGVSPVFNWLVYPRLVLNSMADRTGTQGVKITNFTVTATGGQGSPYSYAATGLPQGIAFSSTGTFSGTPSKVGRYIVTVTAFDASTTRKVTGTFVWTVKYPPLVAVNPGSQISTVGAAIGSLSLQATGGSGDYVYTDADLTLPSGLTLQDNRITGTPTGAGSYPVVLTATDIAAGYSQTVSFTWTVNLAPSVMPPPNTTTAPGGMVSGQAVGAAGTAPYTFALQGAPWWMHIDSNTGQLSGTATTQVADYPGIVIVLTDAKGAIAQSAPFTWSVYQIPTLVPPGDQTSAFGESVALQLQSTCSATPCTFSVQNLPSWLTLNISTGKITGTAPLVQKLYSDITVTITDARSSVASSQFSWVVGPQQTITSPGDQVWTRGQPLKNKSSIGLQITADCPATAPCTFGLAPGSGSLPTGLTMSSTGLITGTPTTKGTWTNIVVQVTNKYGTVKATSFTWIINDPPTLAAIGNQRTVWSGAANLRVSAVCLSDPCQFTATSLPTGLTMDSTGLISGYATGREAPSNVTVTVTDKTGASASRTFTWYVLSIDVPDQSLPQSTSLFICWNNSKASINLNNYVMGYSNVNNLTFTISGGSGWLSLSGAQLTITAPCSTGTSTATVTVKDSGGSAPTATASTSFDIRITR